MEAKSTSTSERVGERKYERTTCINNSWMGGVKRSTKVRILETQGREEDDVRSGGGMKTFSRKQNKSAPLVV